MLQKSKQNHENFTRIAQNFERIDINSFRSYKGALVSINSAEEFHHDVCFFLVEFVRNSLKFV